MSESITLGFGDGSLAGLVRSDGRALICLAGKTAQPATPLVRPLGGGAGWQATAANGLDVTLEPLGEPARFADGATEWLCRARGLAGGATLDCLGQATVESSPTRTRKRIALTRGVAAWFDPDLAIVLRARRPPRAENHGDEQFAGFVLRGSPPEPHPIDDPRLSTTYAAGGQQRRAGLELWETEDSDFPIRVYGEAVGEGELALDGGLRLRCAFFVWRHAGRIGAGRYDIVVAGG